MTTLSGNDFNTGNAFFLCLMSKHGSGYDVSDGVDGGDVTLEVMVDNYSLLVVEDESNLLCTQLVGVGSPAGGHEDVVGGEYL
jgi:hypothetical protein